MRVRISTLVAAALFCIALAVYGSHMAPSVVPGDPGEYQLVAARWGIAHPPGYGFYALLGNVFTHLLPVGSWAWRANLLSAVCAAAIVVLVYAIGLMIGPEGEGNRALLRHTSAALGALTLAMGLDLWQHALHANAHILTAALATLSLFLLLRWWRTRKQRWLYFFCFVAGLSPVQHPLLVFCFPAYTAFILAVRPGILREWRTLVTMCACAGLGLMAYLYYPLRTAIAAPPPPGPDDMDTWAGFVRVVTAQGLRVNLGGFRLVDVLRRLWDVRVPLRLQYTLPALLLAAVGMLSLWQRRWRPALLLTGLAGSVILVTVNVLQDAMAYLLTPVVIVGVWIGLGALEVGQWLHRRLGRGWSMAWLALLFALPLQALAANWERMDLSTFRDADDWLASVESRFQGQGKEAQILTEWERMTTVSYYASVEGRAWPSADMQFVNVHAGSPTPFLEAAEAHLDEGPVYLTSYRPEVLDRYRLMPSGDLWQVLPQWPTDLPAEANPVDVVAEGRLEIVGWRLNQSEATPGDVLLLDLYMRMPDPEGVEAQRYYLPWAQLGGRTYRFTTGGRYNTPWWQSGEIVVERLELPVAWNTLPERYPLRVGVQLVNEGRDLTLGSGGTSAALTEVVVGSSPWRPSEEALKSAVGNLGDAVLLSSVRVNGANVSAERFDGTIQPGESLRVVLDWEALRPIDENYKVFVQLLDGGLQVRAQGDDKAPLRGSAPTLLWFPRWRRGMRIADTYELSLPADLPPGEYPLVVGMYGFTSFRRIGAIAADGNMEGDWITVAHLRVDG
ncbi:MAG: protein O-mannosyl-transferase family [Anaerolineae bacterium]